MNNSYKKIPVFPFEYNSDSKFKLFCFPHAGGSAIAFKDWVKYSEKEDFEIIPVEYPGRNTRLSEKYMESVKEEAKKIAEVINQETNDCSYALFGHSFGSLLAFQTEYQLEKEYSKFAFKLVVSGRQPPFMEDKTSFRTSMGEEALIKEMREMKTVPEELLENKTYREFFLPIIMSDYKKNEDYIYEDELIQCPVLAYSSSEDFGAEPEVMKYWEKITKDKFKLIEKNGPHFFVYDEKKVFFNEMIERLMVKEVILK